MPKDFSTRGLLQYRKMKRITIFSWGSYGWGNATKKLITAVDAVEESRGFEPPIFVDCRIRRSGRAIGFIGTAFEDLLKNRHEWMRDLGNEHVRTKKGKRIQIRRPEAANDLINLAIKANKEKRRLIFFCACPWPKSHGKNKCHRAAVADLLVDAAEERTVPIRVVEWPGDERRRLRMDLDVEAFRAVRNRRMFIPLPRNTDWREFAGLPWGSIITFSCEKESIHRVVGPLIWRLGRWHIQILQWIRNPNAHVSKYEVLAQEDVVSYGLERGESL